MKTTNLAIESARLASDNSNFRAVTRTIGNVKITDIKIPPEAAARLNHPAGRCITLEGDPTGTALPALLKRGLEQLLPPSGLILAAGLGNPDITRDSLGAFTVRRLIPRRGSRYTLAAVETDVAARTGIETVRMVRAIAHELKASCVIAIDSLCCSNPARLCHTVQLSTAGITPGSGAAAPRKELSRRTIGIPVIAAGVPTAALLSSVTKNPAHKKYLAAPTDEDIEARVWSDCIATAINSII
ncbi:MAG: GPR endopeptidase [Oscillospiraceae bacterium]